MAIHTTTVNDGNGNVIGVETFEYDDAPIIKRKAQEALDKSDITISRALEDGITIPQSWKDYRAALRSNVKTGIGPLATPPLKENGVSVDYPA